MCPSGTVKETRFGMSALSFHLFKQVLRVEFLEGFRKEDAVFSNEFVIEIDLAATVVFSLDGDEIPVDLRSVTVVGFFVGLAGS